MTRAIILVLVVLGAVAWFLIGGSTSEWTFAPCSVVSSRVVRADGPYGPHGAAMVMYKGEYQLQYTAKGRKYLIWANAGWLDKDREFVESKVAGLPEQCPSVVRYNPRNPSQAVVQ